MAKSRTEQLLQKEFNLKLENPKILKVLVETLATIIGDVKFSIIPGVFTARAMDQSKICLLEVKLPESSFDEYKCDDTFEIGLKLEDLDKILKRSSPKDTLIISYKEQEQKIKLSMKYPDANRTRTFILALLDLDIEEIPMEKLHSIDYDTTWSIDPDFLLEAIKDAEIYSEILNIKSEEGQGLVFSSSGQIGEMTYELGLEELLEPIFNGKQVGAYSLTFLKSILKLSSITEKLEVSLKTDHPLKMTFSLIEGGTVSYFLAPRVEENDNEAMLEDEIEWDNKELENLSEEVTTTEEEKTTPEPIEETDEEVEL